MLVRIANRENTDQTAFFRSSLIWVCAFFGRQLVTSFQNFRDFKAFRIIMNSGLPSLRLTGGIVLFSRTRHKILCSVLVYPRKTGRGPHMTKQLLTKT